MLKATPKTPFQFLICSPISLKIFQSTNSETKLKKCRKCQIDAMLAIFRFIIDRRLDSPKMPTHSVKSQLAGTWQSVNSPVNRSSLLESK